MELSSYYGMYSIDLSDLANSSVYYHFHWKWVLISLILTSIEGVNLANTAFTTHSKWLRLGGNDVALVTGGLSGLGLEIVNKLIHDHSVGKVIVLDIQKPRIDLGSRVEFIECDVGSSNLKTRMDAIIHGLHLRNQHISVLVNNAGIRASGPLLHMDTDRVQNLFAVNIFAHITILQRVVQNHLKYHRESQLSIVTVSSILGALAPKNLLLYSASKSAITQIHEAFVQELRSYKNITMLLVTPGQLTTDMFQDVSPSRTFFAPVVNHTELAEKIVHMVNLGVSGTLCEPVYANFLPMVKILPSVVQYWCRCFSGMDDKIPDN